DVVSGRHVLLSNGDGTLREAGDVGFDSYPWTAADLDGDGNLDLAGTTFDRETGGIDVSILLGHGDGTFRPPQLFAAVGPRCNLQGATAADATAEGVLDIVTTVSSGPDRNVTVLLGSGDGGFGQPITIALDHDPLALVVADVNADGLPDMAVTSDYTRIPGS